jgi:hypothetical protein
MAEPFDGLIGSLSGFFQAARDRRLARRAAQAESGFSVTAAELQEQIPDAPQKSLEEIGLPLGLPEEQFFDRRRGISNLGDVANPFKR